MIKPGARTLLPEVRVGANGDALAPVSVARRSYAPDTVGWTLFALVAATAAAADRLAKDAVSDRLVYGVDRHLLGPLSLTHTTNSGIAFGLFPTRTSLVALLSLFVLAAVVCFFARSGAAERRLALLVGLIVGGTFGNLFDRLRFGRVTDFVELRFWPAFNLADLFIVVGVVMLTLTLLAREGQETPRPPSPLLDSMEAR